MPPDIAGSSLDLAEALGTGAAAVVHFGRDETDAFDIHIDVRDAGLAGLTNRDLLPLLPAGTRWRHLVGWSSVLGLPVRLMGRPWLVLGVEWVEAHPTRGAYPKLVVSFHTRASAAAVASEVARALDPSLPATLGWTHGTRKLGELESGNLPRVHAQFLLRAANAWSQDEPLLVRSVLLSEEELPPLLPLSPFEHTEWLIGFSRHTAARFSLVAQARLKLFASLHRGWE